MTSREIRLWWQEQKKSRTDTNSCNQHAIKVLPWFVIFKFYLQVHFILVTKRLGLFDKLKKIDSKIGILSNTRNVNIHECIIRNPHKTIVWSWLNENFKIPQKVLTVLHFQSLISKKLKKTCLFICFCKHNSKKYFFDFVHSKQQLMICCQYKVSSML